MIAHHSPVVRASRVGDRSRRAPRPKVVLYNPRAVFYTMPLALLALASTLQQNDVDVIIIDGRLEADPVRSVVQAAHDAVCVGVTVLTGAPIHDALRVSRAVKAARPACTVVWGGWHPSLFAAECLAEPSIDVVVSGQGEDTLVEVVRRLSAGTPVAGHLAAPGLRDLNEFPAHDYSLIDVDRYFALKGRRQIDYISSQGCRFRCAFCADPAVYNRGWSGLAPERIADEVHYLLHRYAMEELAFQDETFFTHPARVERLVEEFLSRGIHVPWTATLRADQACRLGDARLAACVRAGLRRVMVGVESGSQATLDRLKKDVRLDQVLDTAAMCVRHEVGAIFNFIVGFPGEPPESIDASLALAKRLRVMHPRFETPIFSYRPYPGNPIADAARGEGYDLPSGLEAWAEFDYVGARGPWISAARWQQIERFTFYARHAWQPGLWRWPLRAASRWRCDRDWYDFPVEKALIEWVRPPQQVS